MEKNRIHDDVWLEPWTPDWAHEFHLEKQCIIGALIEDGGSVSVRHVGSTSIEGIPSKPIIDILVCKRIWSVKIQIRLTVYYCAELRGGCSLG